MAETAFVCRGRVGLRAAMVHARPSRWISAATPRWPPRHVLFHHGGWKGIVRRLQLAQRSAHRGTKRATSSCWISRRGRRFRASPRRSSCSGLKKRPIEIRGARDYLVVYATEEDVRTLAPGHGAALADRQDGGHRDRPRRGPSEDADFVSRFFAPGVGIPEDPVTGSSHCTLIPYWARRLGRKTLRARQVSARGGELFCEDAGDRVKIGGRAVTYLAGEISV